MLPFFASFMTCGVLVYLLRDARKAAKIAAWVLSFICPIILAYIMAITNVTPESVINAVALVGPISIIAYPMIWYWLERDR